VTGFGGLALLSRGGVYAALLLSEPSNARDRHSHGDGAQSGRILGVVVGRNARLANRWANPGHVDCSRATRVLSSLLFGVSAHDPLIFGGVSLILATAAILACVHPRPPRNKSRPDHRVAR